MKKKAELKVGRKQFDGKEEKDVIAKLESIWAIGGSDAEASFYADISKTSLCRYLQEHIEVSERKERLKEKPTLKARQVLVQGLDGNPELALKYLERKCKKEFAPKINAELKGENDEPFVLKIQRVLSEDEKKLITAQNPKGIKSGN